MVLKYIGSEIELFRDLFRHCILVVPTGMYSFYVFSTYWFIFCIEYFLFIFHLRFLRFMKIDTIYNTLEP